ncbi:MAG: hypothetical protein IKA10_07235 [Oscillospiraceae bacterium]|nr:hypothetical protein [Oscillospiraceae bacterium]
MTPTTLYSDKKLFVSFYKNALSRIRGVAVIYGILMFITYPMFYLINIAEAMQRLALGQRYYGFEGFLDMYTASSLFFFAVVAAAVVSLSAISNSFMHSKKAVDVFHALPVRRPVMLLANFAAVSTAMFVLEAVCYLIVGITSAFTIPIPFIPLIGEFIRVFVLTMAIAAIAAFCAVCANTALDAAIFTAAFNAVVPCYTALIIALLDVFIKGFVADNAVLQFSLRFSPVCMLYQTYFYDVISYTVLNNIIYLVFTALVLAFSCHIYVKRKSERAQSNNTSAFIYRFIVTAASVGGGAFWGFVFAELFGWGDRRTATNVIISCLFTAVIYLIFNAITTRRVNPGKKGFVWMAASLALTLGLFASVTTGFFGMETYLPLIDEIQNVRIYYGGDYDNISRYVPDENGRYRYVRGGNEGVVLEKAEDIAVIHNMHREIIDGFTSDNRLTETQYVSRVRFEVEYTLDSGRVVKRDYYTEVPESVIRDFTLIDDMESFKRQMAPMLISPASDLEFFEIKDGFGKNHMRLELTGSEKEMLYNAIAQDTLNRTSQMKKQHNEMSLAKISLRYKTVETDRNGIVLSENSASIPAASVHYTYETVANIEELYSGVCFEVTSSSINTIKALNQLGLEKYTTLAQPQGIKAVVAISGSPYYDTRSANFWLSAKSFDDLGFADHINWTENQKGYFDPQQVAQIADSCTSTIYGPSIKEREPLFMVLFVNEDIDLRYIYDEQPEVICYYMTYDNAPQFVKDEFAKYIYDGGYVIK